MPNIRDIIEAATSGPWPAADEHGSVFGPALDSMCDEGDAAFIATFDPEHVSLMEAVGEAAEKVVADCAVDFLTDCGCGYQCVYVGVCSALARRDTYRKEHGYE